MNKQIETTANITVPKYFDKILKQILINEGYLFTTLRSNINTKTETVFNRYLLLINLIHKKYSQSENRFFKLENSFEILNSYKFINNFEIDLGTVYLSKILFIDRKEIGKMINVLIKHNIITLCKSARPFGNKNKTHGNIYKINNIFCRKSVKVELQSQNVAKQYITNISNYYDNITEGKELLESYKNTLSKLVFPTVEEVRTMFESLIGTYSKKGKLYVNEYLPTDFITTIKEGVIYEEMMANKSDINEHINKYENWITSEGFTFIYINKQDRYYTDLSLMKSEIRDLIKLKNGEDLIENDFCSLHNNLIPILSKTKCDLLQGDSHTKIAEKFEISRIEAKQIGLKYWNSKIVNNSTISSKEHSKYFKKMDIYLQNDYPSIWTFLVNTKKKNHTNMFNSTLTH